MKKDAFYFPHFSNSRHDRKIMRMRMELGLEGYAIYFMLLEVLREQNDYKYPLDDIPVLAHEFGTSEQKVRVCICNYQLFEVDEHSNFFSIKQIYYLQPYIEKTQRARVAAEKRWNRVSDDANAMQMHSKCNANAMQIKESKVKESKVNKSKVNISPTLFEVEDFFLSKGSTADKAKQAFEYYDLANWHDSKGKPVKNWKQKMLAVWINNQNFKQKEVKTKIDYYQELRDKVHQSINNENLNK